MIVEQVTNGVTVRMAVLYLLLGGQPTRRRPSEEALHDRVRHHGRPSCSAATPPTC